MAVLLPLVAALAGANLGGSAQGGSPIRCSIVNLLASPAEFDGKRVQVIGYARIRFEGNALFLSEVDAEHEVVNNSLWLDFSSWREEGKALEGEGNRYVIVEGTFREAEKGHMGMWPGGITRIERFDPWPPSALEQ